MVEFFQFVSQEWLLVTVLTVLIVMLVMHEGRQSGASVTPAELTRLVNNEDGVVVDVRDSKEFTTGHIVGAMNIPQAKIAQQLTMLDKYKDKPVIVVCKFGQHAGASSKILKTAGFERTYKLSGGMAEWQGSQLPVVKA